MGYAQRLRVLQGKDESQDDALTFLSSRAVTLGDATAANALVTKVVTSSTVPLDVTDDALTDGTQKAKIMGVVNAASSTLAGEGEQAQVSISSIGSVFVETPQYKPLTVYCKVEDGDLEYSGVLKGNSDGVYTLPAVRKDTPVALTTENSKTALITDNEGRLYTSVMFTDETGGTYGIKQINNKPRVSSMPYLYDIAEGNVAGHTEFEQFGLNPDVDIASEDIWSAGGAYVFPASAQGLEIVSSSANDDGDPVGTGVRVVTIYYLTSDFTAKTEDVTLNGTGVVNTSGTDFYRINSLRAKTCGALGAAAGVITLRQRTPATAVYSQIEVGNTRSRNSVYTVPKATTLYITSMSGGCGFAGTAANPSNSALITLRGKYDHLAGVARDFFLPHAELQVSGGVFRPFEIPIRFPAGTDIKCSATSAANNAQVSVGLRGWLE
jgi:hypothetical protein